MPWITPRTWVADELVDATMLNTHIRDNLAALKDPPTHVVVRDNSANGEYYSTTAGALVPVDSTNLKLTLNTNGGAVMVGLTACVFADNASGRYMTLDIRVDGSGAWATDQGFGGGIATIPVTTTDSQIFFFGPVLITGLPAGQHTFELMWRMNTGLGYMRATTISSYSYVHEVPIIFWAREVS